MKNNASFEQLLADNKLKKGDYVGLGNPNSTILFIGKEAGESVDNKIIHGSVESWAKMEVNYAKRYEPTEENMRNLGHTWQRYQRLYNCIREKLNLPKNQHSKYEISFVEELFTTELSQLPAPNTITAKTNPKFYAELERRKRIFFDSDFINGFRVIVIFAMDNKYIETYNGEVCQLFHVGFDGMYDYDGKDKIWVHSSKEEKRLLLHTRQLTNSIGKNLIDTLAEIITRFMKENQMGLIRATN